MSNLFDHLQDRTFKTIGRFFGVDAVWEPSDASPTQEARILFKDPAQSEDVMKEQAINYMPVRPVMEWYEGDLPGLYESVNNRGQEEVVITIFGEDVTYSVLNAEPVHDGQTYKGYLQLKTIDYE